MIDQPSIRREKRDPVDVFAHSLQSFGAILLLIVVWGLAYNFRFILERVDWHYLLLASIVAAALLLPDAEEESDYEEKSDPESEVGKERLSSEYEE